MEAITSPGMYDFSLEDYVKDPCAMPSVNSGIVHTLIRKSPRHAWYEHPRLNPEYEYENATRADLGTVAHGLLLEEDESRVVVISAANWRTKDAQIQRDVAWNEGKLPILEKEYTGIQAMVRVARETIAASEFASDFFKGTAERTLIWEEAGVWCRTRPDKISKDARVIFDYKTTDNAHPSDFWRVVLNQGYDIQAGLQVRGVRKLLHPKLCTHVLIVQEIEPPYAVSFISLSPKWEEMAQDKIDFALAVWRGCLRAQHWPMYRQKVAYLDPPSFADTWADNCPDVEACDL